MGLIHSYLEYREYALDRFQYADYEILVQNQKHFEEIEICFYIDTKTDPIEESMEDTLRNYVKENPSKKTFEAIDKIVQDCNIGDTLIGLIDLGIFRIDNKKWGIVLFGSRNGGKTELIQNVGKVFHCFDFLETNSNFCEKLLRPKYKFQMVLFDEGCKSKLFK